MPEYPDITVYLEALEKRIMKRTLQRVQIASPFLLRTATPPLASVEGRKVVELRRLGKRICIGLQGQNQTQAQASNQDAAFWLVLHLMIAGRLHWKEGASPERPSKTRSRPKFKAELAAFQFENGLLTLTEAGTQRRAALHIVQGEDGLRALDPGGLQLFQQPKRKGSASRFIDLDTFASALVSENHTLKRALTDPRLFSGIGNAYSDEILWEAKLSPIKLTQKLSNEEIERLHRAVRDSLTLWVERLRAEAGDQFPEKVTAFREGMAVHGRYREACPRCGAKIQRIRYATNETNYCPGCQTEGKLLADRALSRLLKEDWPRTAEELS